MDNHIYLAHHGIKGQKWGVRRFQNDDGSLTSAGRKRYDGNTSNIKRVLTTKNKFGTIARSKEKRDMLQNKIAKTGDRGIIARTINDHRAGRIAQIDRKIENRQAKRAYLKERSAENKERLGKARVNRLVKNGLLGQIPNAALTEGKYKRHRENGNTIATAALKTFGGVVITSAAIYGASRLAGAAAAKGVNRVIQNNLERAMREDALKRAAALATVGR